MLELLKLVAVLVNQMSWTKEAETTKPEIYTLIHQCVCFHRWFVCRDMLTEVYRRLGKLLLFMLSRAMEPESSPAHPVMLDVKNRVAEVFMFLPPELTAAFVREQAQADCSDSGPLCAVLDHLEAMLIAVRVEKIWYERQHFADELNHGSYLLTLTPRSIQHSSRHATDPHALPQLDRCGR